MATISSTYSNSFNSRQRQYKESSSTLSVLQIHILSQVSNLVELTPERFTSVSTYNHKGFGGMYIARSLPKVSTRKTVSMSGLTPEQLAAFNRDGFLVIPGALSPSLCNELRAKAGEYVAQCDVNEHRSIFTTNEQTRRMNDEYFIESGDKIRYFFEEHAFQADNKTLAVPLEVAINKIGHNLHNLDPVFEKVSYAPEVKEILKSLKYSRPMAVQSMYIFKQPSIGGEVKPHQDGTYLYTEPQSVVGFWWALEHCTLENGCLHGVAGSHLTVPVHQRLRRTTKEQQERNGGLLLENVPEKVEPFDVSKSQPLLTKKGDLVLLHSSFVHFSEANRSPHSRHAYSIHVVESHNVAYPADNWLQTTGNVPFKPMYES